MELKKSGQSAAEIAKMLDRSVKWVNRWWAKDKQPGPTSFVNKKGRGRKTKLTFAEQIQASIRSTTIGSNESAKCLKQMGTTVFRIVLSYMSFLISYKEFII